MKQLCKWWLCVFVIFGIASGVASAQEEWMPDPNLRQVVGEALGLSDGKSFKPEHLLQLTRLDGTDRRIVDVTGLEYAIGLVWLSLAGNEISDLRPLTKLIRLETLYLWANPISDISPLANLIQLRDLDLGGCEISNIMPLATLIQLRRLNLRYNVIEDITPLESLTELVELSLSHNRIVDVSPLANLTKLEKLWIQSNETIDHTPLKVLSLTVFEYDESCVLPSLPIHERIENRRFPSIFTAWGGIGWSSVLNLPEKSDLEQMALHDLYFCCLIFNQQFRETSEGRRVVGEINQAIELRDAYLAQNPNMLFIAGLEMREAYPTSHPLDSPFWLRDENGERILAAPEDGTLFLDFTSPVTINKIVEEAIVVSKCGLYDGIFFDWWTENGPVLANNETGWSEGYVGFEAEQRARDIILTRIREAVREDFLILVNTNRRKIPRTGWAINGTFMETLRDHDVGYTHDGLAEIESTLLWSEVNLREPRINCLEGWGVPTESPDSPRNLRWMRVFTTMSLTHSDGYVLYNGGIQHEHYWYDFWDADLGQPVGEKAQRYENRDGLFIREFTNGWAVYNRSGSTQEIRLPEQATGVESGLQNIVHSVPDLDGEIYLKRTTNRYDVNGDGTVNILDLVVVASGLGTDAPDVNGDGSVNILDLVAVANAF
jgi:hypothetical protein